MVTHSEPDISWSFKSINQQLQLHSKLRNLFSCYFSVEVSALQKINTKVQKQDIKAALAVFLIFKTHVHEK